MLHSCVNANLYTPVVDASGAGESSPITVEVDIPEIRELTRTSFTETQLNRISDLNIFIYHNGNLLSKYCRYYTDMSSLMLTLPYKKNDFNIYMVGNIGKASAPLNEADIVNLRYTVNSYDDFREMGFPVAASFIGYRKGDAASFKVKRLVGQYNIRMTTSATNAIYRIKDIKLYNCARDMYPFSPDTKASVMAEKGDSLTAEDLTALNAGQTVSLYFVENLQGVLLPDNTDRKKKIPSSLELIESGAADRCTYIEITADISTPGANYTNGRYRFYLGQDETSDFNIKRNTLYNATLDFTQNMVNEEEWRIEVEEPEVTMGFKLDKEEAMVIQGAEDMIFVQAKDKMGNRMDFNMEILSSNGYINVEKVETYYLEDKSLGAATGLRFTSNVALSGLYAYETEPDYKTETVRISSVETYNGIPLYSKDIKVRIYYKLFPLLIKLEKFQGLASNPYEIVLRGQNPMRLGLAVSGSYVADGATESISEFKKYDYILNGSRTDRTVDPEGASFADLRNVTTANLSRIDFIVKGISEVTGITMAYPKLTSSGNIFMGSGNDAWFGPGSSMYPASYPNLPDDGYISMGYKDYGFDLGYTNTEWRGWTSSDDHEGSYTRTQTFPFSSSEGFRHSDYYAKNGGKVFFTLNDGMGVHIPTINGYRHASHGFQTENKDKYGVCPFHFVNGGLTLFYTYAVFNHKRVLWPKENSNGITCRLYGTGRDIFTENRNGSAINNVHEMAFWMKRWKNLVGKTKTKQTSQKYTGQLYMTINGCSTWTGCDTSESGFFTDDY